MLVLAIIGIHDSLFLSRSLPNLKTNLKPGEIGSKSNFFAYDIPGIAHSSCQLMDCQYFNTEMMGAAIVVRLHALDPEDTPPISSIHREMSQLVESQHPEKLVVDFHDITRCTSQTVEALLHAQKLLKQFGGNMALSGVSDQIRDVFQILNLDGKVFKIYDRVPDAANDR